MELQWREGTAVLRCPVCGRDGEQDLVVTATHEEFAGPIDVGRCRDCGALVCGGVLPPEHYAEGDITRYIEHLASIDALAGMLVKAGAGPGARVLDIGCGYGFALDVGQFLFGWEGIGLDPSLSAERGRAELGLDIRPGTLDETFAPDERFDVVFASEVLEHIPEPLGFLRAVHGRLASGGVLVLTTPDADAVKPETSLPVLHAVLSLTAHEFLVDAAGLERMLEEAGFSAHVWRDGDGLRAVAGATPEALRAARPDATVDLPDLLRYLDWRADSAPSGSALGVGMALRYVKMQASSGALEEAGAALPRLRKQILDGHDFDLRRPRTTSAAPDPSPVLVPAHYFSGIVDLVHRADPKGAMPHFAASAAIARNRFELDGDVYADPETPALEAHSLHLYAVLVAQRAPRRVPAALAALDAAFERGAGTQDLVDLTRKRVDEELGSRTLRRKTRQLVGSAVRRPRRLLTRPRTPR